MSFASFFNSLSNFVEPAVEFLFGEKEYESGDVVGRSGGFLGTAASAYLSSQKDAQDYSPDLPKYQRVSGSGPARGIAVGQAQNMIGLNRPDMQVALRRFMREYSSNNQTNKFFDQYRTERTLGTGRKTLGVAAAQIPEVTETSAAPVRTEAKKVEVSDG